MTTTTAQETGTIAVVGKCAACKTTYRYTLPAALAVYMPHKYGVAFDLAGIGFPTCACRDSIPCEMRYDRPACGKDVCTGHRHTAVNVAQVKVTYKADTHCAGECWAATGAKCACSCRGENHGRMHAVLA